MLDYQDLLGELFARRRFGVRPGLDAMRAVLASAKLGDPQRRFPALHIAGTNGKGSVAAMTASIARATGLKTALYTSPHLSRLSERFVIDGREISDGTLANVLRRVLAADPELTFFEVCTAAAFVWFADENVDVAIVEVGLGGRLDATNVLPHVLASAVTSIGLDHQAILGDTLALIAAEKAGILRARVPVVLGNLPAAADEIVVAHAHAIDAGPILRASTIALDRIALVGAHQGDNAGVAVALSQFLPRAPTREQVDSGLAHVAWPGRFERIAPDVIVDGAHNPDGARALAAALAAAALPRPRALVLAISADKDLAAMTRALEPHFDHVMVTRAPSERAAAPAAIAVHLTLPFDVIDDPLIALATARQNATITVAAGSLFLVGAVRAHVLGERVDAITLHDPSAAKS